MSDTGFGPALLVRVIEDLLYDLRKWRGSIDGTRDGIVKGTSTSSPAASMPGTSSGSST
ncbi:hypothetical protein [Burkholderia sp. Ac-20349]|uniref:hypothetical protein n=1 Tax=Burkholderia sp. Ac-20349 TaxID=2703893 RepID=UPI00197C3943|nr:hypothetical protein [Burkholderia sp. Ac-20349]MBN3844905.1 hypothetical protein [Burkholderia sp. Ac-20349]